MNEPYALADQVNVLQRHSSIPAVLDLPNGAQAQGVTPGWQYQTWGFYPRVVVNPPDLRATVVTSEIERVDVANKKINVTQRTRALNVDELTAYNAAQQEKACQAGFLYTPLTGPAVIVPVTYSDNNTISMQQQWAATSPTAEVSGRFASQTRQGRSIVIPLTSTAEVNHLYRAMGQYTAKINSAQDSINAMITNGTITTYDDIDQNWAALVPPP